MPDNSLDLTTRILNAVINDWPLIAFLAGFAWKGLPWAFRVHGPGMVISALDSKEGRTALHENMTEYFNNGGGEKIRSIVASENAMQTERHKDETRTIVRSAISDHEKVESRRFQEAMDNALDGFKEEITGEFDLKPARHQPPRRRGRRVVQRRSTDEGGNT